MIPIEWIFKNHKVPPGWLVEWPLVAEGDVMAEAERSERGWRMEWGFKEKAEARNWNSVKIDSSCP